MAMAAKDMEGVLRRDRCVALPTPPHGGASIGDAPLEKTIPNYLKPTLCSSHCTSCHYPKNQQQRSQPSTVPTAAAASSGKRLLSKPPMQKACPTLRAARTPPLSSEHKPAICKDPGPEKASKPRSLPKATTKAKPVDVQDHAKVTEAEALRSTLPKNRKVEDGPIKGSEASAEPADMVDASKKPRTRARSMSMSSIDLAAGPRKLNLLQGGKKAAGNESKATAVERAVSKRQEAKMGKESPPAKNAVKEEAASKLAARRNKVKALVGAFETAMSLHETEKQPSTEQHEEVAEPVKSRSAAADDGRGLQETKVTPEEKGQNQEEEEEEDTAGGQREVGEESKNGPSEEEEEEDNGREGVDSLETRH